MSDELATNDDLATEVDRLLRSMERAGELTLPRGVELIDQVIALRRGYDTKADGNAKRAQQHAVRRNSDRRRKGISKVMK
jgi:hypothetical protein